MEGGGVVFLRHGASLWNEADRFTGWHDVPLSPLGEKQAVAAAEICVQEGLCFDLVYTSTLKRTVKTAWLLLEALDDYTVPIRHLWQLNERMYGGLTGLSKSLTRQAVGEERFEQLRNRPPPLSEGSCFDPALDSRFRSVPRAAVPNGESFEQTRERVRPVWENEILPQAAAGKMVLVISSKNLLRSLFAEILQIPTHALRDVDVPNGCPMFFDVASGSMRLLGPGAGSVRQLDGLVRGQASLTPAGMVGAGRAESAETGALRRNAEGLNI